MYRRRRIPREKISFSFDSFLDVVANVNGIIIKLIVVAWAGARAYQEGMTFVDLPPEPPPPVPVAIALPEPKADDNPLTSVIEKHRRDLAEARAQLARKASEVDAAGADGPGIARQLTALALMKETIAKQSAELTDAAVRESQTTQAVALSLEELVRRGRAVREAIARVESAPGPRKELRYHTPVSKTVTSDEIFFECKSGRVTYLDLPGLMRDIEDGLRDKEDALRERFSVEDVTRASGAFRLRYTIVRRRNPGEALGAADRPRDRVFFGYGLGRFVVEPIAAIRGESQDQALRPTSEFRQTVDALDSQTVVTFWVYPDSFALFRTLRNYLYERGIEVAARPLPETEPIAGSPSGSRSRGQ